MRLIRSEADGSDDQAAGATKQAAVQLVRELGLTVRDTAQTLGVSFQWVQQLIGKRSPEALNRGVKSSRSAKAVQRQVTISRTAASTKHKRSKVA